MKNIPHEVPVKTNPEIKVSRSRRRIYQNAAAQPDATISDFPESPVAPEAAQVEDFSTLCNENNTECSRKTERHHIPAEIRAERIIDNAMAASMGLGILPLPLIDSAGIMGIQLYMMRELSKTYQIEFSLIRSQAFVTSLIAGLGSVSVATGLFGSLVKLIPVFGSFAGALTLPVIAGAVTYALGRLCIQSFSQNKQIPLSISQSTRRSFERYFKKGVEAANSLNNSRSKDKK